MRRPGFEPGYPAWKAGVIATRPPTRAAAEETALHKPCPGAAVVDVRRLSAALLTIIGITARQRGTPAAFRLNTDASPDGSERRGDAHDLHGHEVEDGHHDEGDDAVQHRAPDEIGPYQVQIGRA